MRDEPLSQEEFRVTEQKKVRRKRWKQRFKNFGLYCIILPSCGLARRPALCACAPRCDRCVATSHGVAEPPMRRLPVRAGAAERASAVAVARSFFFAGFLLLVLSARPLSPVTDQFRDEHQRCVSSCARGVTAARRAPKGWCPASARQ